MIKNLKEAVLIDIIDEGTKDEVVVIVEAPCDLYQGSKSGKSLNDTVAYDYHTHTIPRTTYEDENGRFIDFTNSTWSHLGKNYFEDYKERRI